MTRRVKEKFSQVTSIVLVMVLLLPYITVAAAGITAEQPDMYGIIAPFEDVEQFERIDYAELRLQRLLARMEAGEFNSFTAEERHIVMYYLGMIEEPVSAEQREAMVQAMIEELSIPETTRLATLMSEREHYSELTEDEQALIFRHLNIAYDAGHVVTELFAVMELDGFTLAESVELIRIMSSGLFDYGEAQQISQMSSLESVARFEHFAQRFNISDEVNARRLVNRSFVSMNMFDESTIARHDSTMELELSDYLSANRAEEVYSFVEAMQSNARSAEFGLDVAVEARRWADIESKTDDDWAAVEPIFAAFTSAGAFNEARQMFLNGYYVREIEVAFALGAALQVEPMRLNDAVNNVIRDSDGVDVDDLGNIITYGFAIMDLGVTPMTNTITEHNEIIDNPFNLRLNMNESVNLNSGAAMFRMNVLNIPGRNGFGLNLDLVYNSASADLRRPIVALGRQEDTIIYWTRVFLAAHYVRGNESVSYYSEPVMTWDHHTRGFLSYEERERWISHGGEGEWMRVRQPDSWGWIIYRVYYRHVERWQDSIRMPYNQQINATADRFNDTVGVGWSFDLPFMKHIHAPGADYATLYVPGRGSFFVNNHNVIRDYPLRDIRLDWYGGFVSGNLTSTRRLRFYDGTRYYFGNRSISERV